MDNTILITGGTGSFGHAFLTYALAQGVQEVRVLSRDEFKQEVMRKELHDSRVKYYLGDVWDRASVDGAMEGVEHVFHAAALKEEWKRLCSSLRLVGPSPCSAMVMVPASRGDYRSVKVFSYEATALLMKTGLVGLGLWVAFVLAVQTNPLLFNNVGMVILFFFMIDATMIDRPSHSPQLP